MRSKLDIIRLKINKFNSRLELLDSRVSSLRYRRRQEVMRVFEKFFTPDSNDIRIYTLSDRRLELALLDDKYGSIVIERVNQEDIERGSWSDELVDFKAWSNGVTLKSVEELEKRAELQIQFTQQFSDFKDDAIAEINNTQERYDTWISKLYKEIDELRKEKAPFSKELSQLEEENLMNQLVQGVEFKLSEPTRWNSGRFPELQVKYDWTIRDVKKVKVLRLTPSGKSADIEVLQEWKDWEGNVQTRVETVERVRLDNIKSTLRQNINN